MLIVKRLLCGEEDGEEKDAVRGEGLIRLCGEEDAVRGATVGDGREKNLEPGKDI